MGRGHVLNFVDAQMILLRKQVYYVDDQLLLEIL
jgi:hypothetical protein